IKNFARYNIDDENERIELLYNIAELFYFSMSTNTMNTKIQSCKDTYDNMLLRCASEGKVNFLISDDIKSGLHNIELGKTKILTSDDFIKRYYNK
ncbi:MAG: PIN domain-containing protein, partial [Alkaliphilus sp.]|nr:PIN domain-containing protein [Alkaliphilus sp.]